MGVVFQCPCLNSPGLCAASELKMYRHIFTLQQVSRRALCSSTRRQVENRVPLKQKLFQEDNGIPVHLKGGTVDALLYRGPMAITILGAGWVVFELVKAAYPKKP